jgi:hypothetical protein
MSQGENLLPSEWTPLVPRRRIAPRLGILVALVLFLLLGAPSALNLVSFTLVTALVLGTFPRAYVSRTQFTKQILVMFVPVRVTRYPLKDFEAIETDIEQRMPIETGFLFGFGNLFWAWALDHVFPWCGGDYKLWLRTFSGKRILGWQGDGDSRFKENLDTLEDQTGLPVTRR